MLHIHNTPRIPRSLSPHHPNILPLVKRADRVWRQQWRKRGGGGRLKLKVWGLGEVSSLQRDRIKIEMRCQTENKPWKSNGGGGGALKKKQKWGEKKKQQKLSKQPCLCAVSFLTVAPLDRSARLAFNSRPKRRWINSDVCNSTGWCRAHRDILTWKEERKKKETKRREKVCALAATVAKNTLPTSSARLPLSWWSMWFFLEFSPFLFPFDHLTAEVLSVAAA